MNKKILSIAIAGAKIIGSYAEDETTGGLSSDTFTVGLGHSWGNNTIVVNYSQASDVIAGFDDKAWNIGFDHTLPKENVDLYASFFIPNWIRPPGCPASKTTTLSCSARESSLISLRAERITLAKTQRSQGDK